MKALIDEYRKKRGDQKARGMFRNDFTHFVIPDLIRNPVFSNWIPAGVYSAMIRGRGMGSSIYR